MSVSQYDDYDFPLNSEESGCYGNLSTDQETALVELRSHLIKANYTQRLDTLSLLRFLRKKDFNVEQAQELFKESEDWRTEFGPGKALDPEKAKQVQELYPRYYHGVDRDGRPIYIEKVGQVDFNKLLVVANEDELLRSLVFSYEQLEQKRLPACSRTFGHLIETFNVIFDLKGLWLSSIPSVFHLVKQVANISALCLPKRLHKFYILNAPWGFYQVFNASKHFLDATTVAKMSILGSDFRSLLQDIDANQLSVEYGGTCKCEGGCMHSDKGPWKTDSSSN